MNDRVYVCHTFYHVYIACLKELTLEQEKRGKADLILSTMSNDFGNLDVRARRSGLFGEVYWYEEKEEHFFPELQKYHTDKGNIVLNMWNRMKFAKKLGRAQTPYIPVDFKTYQDIYVFCDSDPIGYYLAAHKIYYHALEDGLDCIRYYDTARYDNRGHFALKAWMAAHNLIFIQNGYSKYCLDMEVNDISVLPYPCKKYIEKRRTELTKRLTASDKKILVELFIENRQELEDTLQAAREKGNPDTILVLSEPLCDLPTRERIFRDIIAEYGEIDGKKATVLIKPHPRDLLDYKKLFSEHIVLSAKFPMEILNYIEGLTFSKVVTVFTVPSAIQFAKEHVFLGEDFMDRYEAPEIHRQNEQI